MRGMADRLRHGTIAPEVVERCAQAWAAHAANAGGKGLARAVFRASTILTADGKLRRETGKKSNQRGRPLCTPQEVKK